MTKSIKVRRLLFMDDNNNKSQPQTPPQPQFQQAPQQLPIISYKSFLDLDIIDIDYPLYYVWKTFARK